MSIETVIIKEELDIDDTKIKLELNDEEDDAPALGLTCAGSLWEIIEERPNMITVPVNDYKSEDELNFIASLNTLDQQKKLFETSACEIQEASALREFQCEICNYICENQLLLASHQINHQLNRHFCCHGCGFWSNTLEEILEHEYRKHAGVLNRFSCRICFLELQDAGSLAKHMSRHIFVRRFVCSLCRRYFESRPELQLHRDHSKDSCGRVEYVDSHGNVGQLVTINDPEVPLQAELLCDVKIKSEPLDTAEEQIEQQHQFSNVVIKTEPKDAHEKLRPSIDINWPSGTSLPENLRAKLRLPAIKKPFKSEFLPKIEAHIPSNPAIQFVPVKKCAPIPIAISAASKKLPNILKPTKSNNQQQTISQFKKNILKMPIKNNPNIASNILKAVPSNCMVFKLPANTKIIRIPPKTSNTTNVNTNSCAVVKKTITPLNSTTISPCPNAPVNRNAYLSNLSVFEKLPESRKIIEEFQNQIRSIEQTSSLPGSVLQKPKKICTESKVLPKQLETVKLPPKKLECPKCDRSYETYFPICNHLKFAQNIAKGDFKHKEEVMRSSPKTNKTALKPNESQLIKLNSALMNNPAVPSPLTSEVAADEAATRDIPAAKDADPSAVPAIKTAVSAKPEVSVTLPLKRVEAGESTKPKNQAQYQCEDCSKTFTTVGAVRIHKLIHTGELPHKCNFCDKRFRTPGQVRVHQRRHTGEKPFKCKICSLDFTHRETLISHLSRHIGMKRYKCYGCNKCFVVVSGLRAHLRLRPDTCGKVKFTARAHGPRVRVIRGEVIFESHPEHNGYLRSEDPLKILSEMNQVATETDVSNDTESNRS